MIKKEIYISKGTLTYKDYESFIKNHSIHAEKNIPKNSIQPASLDLRLGKVGYEISSSFVPIDKTVLKKLKYYKKRKVDLSNGFLFKKNVTYLIELQEKLNLNKNIFGKCNPKSSTGRLDIFCRIITDYNSEYEIIKNGYKGSIYIEVTSKTFDIILTEGDKLNQLRLRNGKTHYLNDNEILKANKENYFLYDKKNQPISPQIDNGIKIRASIDKSEKIIAYKAKKNAPALNYNKIRYYKKSDYWIPIKKVRHNSIIIEPNEFYIMKSSEKIRIFPNLAAEMVPYDTDIGEFRVHYAGFFDPGFGNIKNGSHAVLEIKTYEVPFAIEDGQNVARLLFEKLEKVPDKLYGNSINSNYQNQGLALSKHFRLLG